MRKILLFASAAVMLLTACSKDDDDEPAAQTPTIQNVSGAWKITGATANGIDVYTQAYEACERDDVHTLSSYTSPATTGTYTITDAGTACNPTTADTGLWSLTGTTININGMDYTITSFNGSTMVMSFTFQGSTYAETWTKQ